MSDTATATYRDFAVLGRKPDGSTVYYTGRAGEGFISNQLCDAFTYTSIEGARKRALILNRMQGTDGIRFCVPCGEMTMFHAYIGELRGGLVKITTDRDCLSAELIRFDERVFATEKDMLDCAMSFRNRGYKVCVDTENVFQDYR